MNFKSYLGKVFVVESSKAIFVTINWTSKDTSPAKISRQAKALVM
jgi:hypothetical protein